MHLNKKCTFPVWPTLIKRRDTRAFTMEGDQDRETWTFAEDQALSVVRQWLLSSAAIRLGTEIIKNNLKTTAKV